MAFMMEKSQDAAGKNSAEPPDFTKQGLIISSILVVKLNAYFKKRIKKKLKTAASLLVFVIAINYAEVPLSLSQSEYYNNYALY